MGYLLHHSVDESARSTPDHEAFRFEDQSLTYAMLMERANRLAGMLVEAGVKRSDRVGIYMYKSLDLPVALYGILKAGAAYVPIDPTAPPARVQFIIEDCGIEHLVSDAAHARKLANLLQGLPTLKTVFGLGRPQNLETSCDFVPWQQVETFPTEDPAVRVIEQDLAYIMYTSGSTGAPKGLMHTHASGLAYAHLSAREYGVSGSDRLGNHSPLHFDMSTFEYLTGPLCGATSVIIPEEITLFPQSLAALIEAERLTFWYSVPLALIQLLEQGDIAQRDCSCLRWVLFGGEPFAPKHLNRLITLWPDARFSNSYGPAEVNQCTAYHLPKGELIADEAVPLGDVWPGAEGLLLDEDDREVSKGQPGELVIRAPTMMRGYWARPDLNTKAFFRQPLFADFEKVFYRTGDLVRERSDGKLMFLGRKDRMIKIRGYRVELDEIEAAITALPDVAEAGAVVVNAEDGAKKICAVALGRDGQEIDPDALKRGIAQRLPAYAVPDVLECRPKLPRTGSGKVDRTALRKEFESRG